MSFLCESLEKSLLKEWRECIESLTDIGPIQKRALIKRYSMILMTLSNRRYWNSIGYTLIRFIVTTGSIAVPALLPIKQFDNETNTETIIYWTTWSISLLVSLANGMMSLFKIDKTFFTAGQLFEKIQSEGWMYLTLSGEYSYNNFNTNRFKNISTDNVSDTSVSGVTEGTDMIHNHSTMFSHFMERLERFYTRIMEIDYNPSMKTQVTTQGGFIGMPPQTQSVSSGDDYPQFFAKERKMKELYSVEKDSNINSRILVKSHPSKNRRLPRRNIKLYQDFQNQQKKEDSREDSTDDEDTINEDLNIPPLPVSPDESIKESI